MWLHAQYSQLEYRSQRKLWVWLYWTANARRPNIDTLARRQTFDLGRHHGEHTGIFIFVVFCSVCTGTEADLAASRKEAKYTSLTNSYNFQPIAK